MVGEPLNRMLWAKFPTALLLPAANSKAGLEAVEELLVVETLFETVRLPTVVETEILSEDDKPL